MESSRPIQQRLRSGRRYIEDLHWDSMSDLSEIDQEEIAKYVKELENPLRSGDSFSSIVSLGARRDFETAIENIKRGIFAFGTSRGKVVSTTALTPVMDSPSDLSPNAPPTGFEDPNSYFAGLQAPPAPPSASSTGQASTEGSVDSSGFEKVDHDVLEEYGQQFVNQMQQSLFGKAGEGDNTAPKPDERSGSIPSIHVSGVPSAMQPASASSLLEDDLELDEGFLALGRKSFRMWDQGKIYTLERTPGDIDEQLPRAPAGGNEKQDMSAGTHDDVLEKSYGGGDLIDIPKNEPHPAEPAKQISGDHAHAEDTKSAGNTMNTFDLLGDAVVVPEAHDTKPAAPSAVEPSVPLASSAPLAPTAPPAPPVPAERPHDTDIHDHFHHDNAPFEPIGRGRIPLDQLIEDQVAEVHGDVDEVLHRMQETDEWKPTAVKKEEKQAHHEDSDSDHPDFRSQTPEVEESTFNRRGPLTIPEVPEKAPTTLDDVLESADDHNNSGFEKQPRPPTPPKDISEEDVKPSAFSLAHTPSPSHHDGLHSILKRGGSQYGEPWFDFKTVDPRILDIIYWRDPKKSGIALSLILLVVFILAKYPILSVIAYTGLAVLAGTLGFRIYKTVEAQVKKTSGENPFQEYLAKDLTLPQDRIHAQVDVLAEHGTCVANQIKRLIFVENIVDSAKFALILWSLTYIAYWFSGFALVVLGVLAVFSVPRVYEMYQEPIDANLAKVSEQLKKVSQMIEEKLPFLKKVQAEVEKKEQ